MKAFLRKLRWLGSRKTKEAEFQEEIAFHLEEEADERRAAGLPDEEARRFAQRNFGNIALVKEDTRAAWTWVWLEQFAQDIRYAARTMIANRAFTALAIVSLALGIGANTAIFSFAHAILLRPLPVSDPGSLVILAWHSHLRHFSGTNRHANSYTDANGEFIGGFFPYPVFELLKQDSSVFTSVFGYQGAGQVHLAMDDNADQVDAEYVSGNYFQGLGVVPAAGRLISEDDDRSGSAAVAVINFALSEKFFGGPLYAIGRSIWINNVPFALIGVTPEGFFGADPGADPGVYVPMRAGLLLESPGRRATDEATKFIDPDYDWVVPMARLRPGITAVQAQGQLSGLFIDWERRVPQRPSPGTLRTLIVKEAPNGLDGLQRQYSKPLYILMVLVALILSIACANIANLQLARAAARQREMAVRLSIGAGAGRVFRQLLTESTMLALLGGAAGVAIAYWGIRFLTLLLANGNFVRAELNWSTLGVALLLSVATGILFGIVPAIQATRVDLVSALKTTRGRVYAPFFSGWRLRQGLVVLQIGMTLMILVAAGLFLRTFVKLRSIELGFNPENLLTFSVNARQAGHNDPEIIQFYRNLQSQFAAIPGVSNAGLSEIPVMGRGTSATGVRIAGNEPKMSRILPVGTGFFSTTQIPITLGRAIDDQDRPGGPNAAVINETFAKTFASGQNPIGQHIELPHICPKCDIEIVGVAADARYGILIGPVEPIVYLAFAQSVWGPVGAAYYELRTTGDASHVVESVREIVRRADNRVPVADVRTQRARIDRMISQEIAFARLSTAFAILALTISCVGLYGTMSYNVARQTSEIGIRMALGAQRLQILRMVLREVFVVLICGLTISLPTALLATKLVRSLLFEVQPNDPASLAVAVVILVCATVLAGYVPARHASRIDPLIALRHE